MVTECNFPTAQGRELRALRTLKRETKSPFIFVSERGAPFTVAGLAELIERAPAAYAAWFLSWRTREQTPAHCRPISGHRSIQSTVRYTELAPGRFKNLWR